MSHVLCPECNSDDVEELAREILDPGLERTFACNDCGNGWSVVF